MLVLTGMGLIVCLGLAVIDSSTEQADGHVHSPSQGNPRSGAPRRPGCPVRGCHNLQRMSTGTVIWTCQGATSLGLSSLEFCLAQDFRLGAACLPREARSSSPSRPGTPQYQHCPCFLYLTWNGASPPPPRTCMITFNHENHNASGCHVSSPCEKDTE